MEQTNKFSYSFYEDFDYSCEYDSVEEALAAAKLDAKNDDEFKDAKVVYIGRVYKFVPVVDAWNIIENLQWDADDEAYEELKLEVIPEMEKSIKLMVGKTTDGKYNDVIYNNDEGMLVENSVGELVPISKLSMGTIDQMYLGFRMGISKKFGDLPIILDESFAYYDDERLENTLNTLLKLNKQIIIMTCSDREKNILDKLKEKYNYLEV